MAGNQQGRKESGRSSDLSINHALSKWEIASEQPEYTGLRPDYHSNRSPGGEQLPAYQNNHYHWPRPYQRYRNHGPIRLTFPCSYPVYAIGLEHRETH